jgi:hypothetical protein
MDDQETGIVKVCRTLSLESRRRSSQSHAAERERALRRAEAQVDRLLAAMPADGSPGQTGGGTMNRGEGSGDQHANHHDRRRAYPNGRLGDVLDGYRTARRAAGPGRAVVAVPAARPAPAGERRHLAGVHAVFGCESRSCGAGMTAAVILSFLPAAFAYGSVVTTPAWAPLSRRLAGVGPDDTVHDGIPRYLRGALDDWVYECYPDDTYQWTQLENTLKFRLRLDELPRPPQLDDEQILDLVDALLAWELQPQHLAVQNLDELLTAGGAGWRINANRNGLERRVDATVTAAVAATVRSVAGDAADHLRTAWDTAYGRNPDPDKAYDEAVLAVEAVACPLVCPTNPRRTLGTVIADLGNQHAQWALAVGDATGQPAGPGRLVEMLKLLWQGQSRHAGSPNSRRQTQAESEAAVHLAAALVQWLTSGVLYRR